VNPNATARPGTLPRPGDASAANERALRRRDDRRREAWIALALRMVSYASLILLWIVASARLGEILPGPAETFAFIQGEFANGRMLRHVGITTQRVLTAFVVAMTVGIALGTAMGRSRRFDDLMQGYLMVTLTVPRILLFVVAYLTAGLNDRALVIALVITVLPTIVVNVREGTRAIDEGLVEMARAFRRHPLAIWRSVVLPQTMPFVIGTARGTLSLSWKMVVLGELLGRSSGVGYQISFYFQTFTMRGVLGYGLTMMALLAAIDLLVMGAIERRAFRWRKPVRVGSVG
jgi:NitT/TauT family transport system permease protein